MSTEKLVDVVTNSYMFGGISASLCYFVWGDLIEGWTRWSLPWATAAAVPAIGLVAPAEASVMPIVTAV